MFIFFVFYIWFLTDNVKKFSLEINEDSTWHSRAQHKAWSSGRRWHVIVLAQAYVA